MELRQQAVLSEKLKTFIQSGNYESYVLELMNLSKIVFPAQYERNPIQSAGECDFFDVKTHEKYEAKLPFDKKFASLCDKGEIEKAVNKELEEFVNLL